MEKKEKVDFILEQMRLCLAKKDYIRCSIISKKISTKYFEDAASMVSLCTHILFSAKLLLLFNLQTFFLKIIFLFTYSYNFLVLDFCFKAFSPLLHDVYRQTIVRQCCQGLLRVERNLEQIGKK